MRARVEADRGDSEHDPLTWAKAGKYALDLKLWAFALLFMCSTMPAYAFSYFLPVILRGMGYSVRDSQLLSAPPYVAAVIVAFSLAALADRLRLRAPFIAVQAIITIVGLAMTAFGAGNATRYAGVFLGISGCQGNIPAVLAYQANNIVGQSKRAFSSALVIGFGGIGGIFASTVFRERDAPTYRPGIWATIGCQLLILTILAMTTTHFALRNGQAKKGGKLVEGRQGFYYTL